MSDKLRGYKPGVSRRPSAWTGRRARSIPLVRVCERPGSRQTRQRSKLGRPLRNVVLSCVLLTLACGTPGGGAMHALHQEATGATRQALSCVPQSVLASLPLWTPQGSYSEGAKVRDGGQAWTCLQSQCPTEWEPGSPRTAALCQAAPVCGIQPWSPASVSYHPGTIVSYNGSLYQGIQPNLSQPGYDPVSAPAVWQPFDPAQNAPGAQGDAAQLTPILDCVALTGFGEYTAAFV